MLIKWRKFILIFFLLLSDQLTAQNGSSFSVNVFLSGCYNEGLMNTTLLEKNLIPKYQPYDDSIFNYFGQEEIANFPNNMVDWVLVELRPEESIVNSRRAGILLDNGLVVDTDGKSPLNFLNINEGSYFLVVKHRNHLGVMSRNKILIKNETISYDFTDSSTKVIGIGSVKDLGGGVFGLLGGDSNSSGIVNNLDYQPIANKILRKGYLNEDLDLNGIVNVLDYSVVFQNILKQSNVPKIKSKTQFKFYVSNYSELLTAITAATDGDNIAINDDIIVPFGEEIRVEKDLNFWGITNPRPKITNEKTEMYLGLIDIRNSQVEFHKLHIDGQGFSSPRDGMQFDNSIALIDSCDLDDFSFTPVNIYNNSIVTVKNSFIHNNDLAGLGYGISVSSGGTLIAHNNTFNNNRHHVSGGDPSSNQPSFYLFNNIFNKSTDYGNYVGTAIDMHGQAHYTNKPKDIYAGKIMKVYNNVFNDSAPVAIGIRGVPQDSLIVYGNSFANDWQWYDNKNSATFKGAAIQQYQAYEDTEIEVYGNFYIGDNTYSGVKPPYHWDQWEKTFQVQYNGNWNRVCAMSNFLDTSDCLFGDFNNDGVTDIVVNSHPADATALSGYPEGSDVSGKIFISWGGLTMWQVLNSSNYLINSLTVADVDGDGRSDLIYNKSTYSSAGERNWASLPNDFSAFTPYTKRDFNGDGKNDKFRISSE